MAEEASSLNHVTEGTVVREAALSAVHVKVALPPASPNLTVAPIARPIAEICSV